MYVCSTQLPVCSDKQVLLTVSPLTACNKPKSVWYLPPLPDESQWAVMHPLSSFPLCTKRSITNGPLQIMKNELYLCPAQSYHAFTPSPQTPTHFPPSLPRRCYVSQECDSSHLALHSPLCHMAVQARTQRQHSSCSTELLGLYTQIGIQNLC